MQTSSIAGGNTEVDGGASFTYVDPPVTESSDNLLLGTCGQKGRYGPTDDACPAANVSAAGQKYKYSVTNAGVQELTIPKDGYYIVAAHGAKGGVGVQDGP